RSHVELMRSMAVLTEVVDRTGLQVMEIHEGLLFDEMYPTVLVQDPQVVSVTPVDHLDLEFGEAEVVVRSATEERRAAYGDPIEIGGVRFRVGARPAVEEGELFIIPRFSAADFLARQLDIR